MYHVGITGGIGSGKSVVCRIFGILGIPVFNADDAAKHLMETDTALIAAIKALLGENVYAGNTPDRTKIAAAVFGNPELLERLNNIVHPATIAYAQAWQQAQTAAYTLKESALLFESGTYKDVDAIIGVTAPVSVRIRRAMQRSNLTAAAVEQRIARQLADTEKMSRCHFVITNDDVQAVLPQVLKIHDLLLQAASQKL
jgi:dephospho-CoA kinase